MRPSPRAQHIDIPHGPLKRAWLKRVAPRCPAAALPAAAQVLGRLHPRLPAAKSGKALLGAVREATAVRHAEAADLWEILGDLLAATDPAGD